MRGSDSGPEPDTADGRGVDQEFLALERELAVFLRRARAPPGALAPPVPPHQEPPPHRQHGPGVA
ncbi:hypothetical protein ACFV00_12460, partial [Streptomyces californicus]